MHDNQDRNNWILYYPLLGIKKYGKKNVDNALKSVNNFNFFLVAAPSTNNNFIAPLRYLKDDAFFHKKERNIKLSVIICGFYFFLSLLLFLTDISIYVKISLSVFIALLCANGIFEWKLIFSKNNREIYKSFNDFYSMCIYRSRFFIWWVVLFFVIIGFLQLIMILYFYDGIESLVLRYGFVFSEVAKGEYWRVIFEWIHGGFDHWLSNTLIAVIISSIAYPFLKNRLPLVFIVSSFVSYFFVYIMWVLTNPGYDGLVGLSGGISGVSGWILISSLLYKDNFPRFFLKDFVIFNLASFFIFSFSSNVSFYCHLSGFITGGILAFIFKAEKIDYRSFCVPLCQDSCRLH